MRKFIIIPKDRQDQPISVTYNHEGQLTHVELAEECQEDTVRAFAQMLPFHLDDLRSFKRSEIKETLAGDTSFETFWDLYGLKIGKIARVKKKWAELQEIDRLACLASIRKWKRYWDDSGIRQPYPETFINQRRWEQIP